MKKISSHEDTKAQSGLSLTDEEHRVVKKLGEAWNLFLELPFQHPDDQPDFRKAIHEGQRLILARVGMRGIKTIENSGKPCS